MNHAKGVLPDAVIRDYRANALLVFADIDPALDQPGVQNLLRKITDLVETTRTTYGPEGEAVATIAVALGSSFFGSLGAPRFGIDLNNIPAGLREAIDLSPAQEVVQHDLLFYLLSTSEQVSVEFMQELSKLKGSGLLRFAVERGFQRKDRREMFGFRDGLRNPRHHDQSRSSFVDRDKTPWEPAAAEGGSYIAYLKIEQSFDAFAALSESEQEQIIGRSIGDGRRLDCPAGTNPREEGPFVDPATPPPNAHVRKVGPRLDEAHDSVKIFRRGVPYSEVDANGAICGGLHFVSFQFSLDLFTTTFRRWMFNPSFPQPGTGNDALHDRGLMTIKKGGVFFVPGEAEGKNAYVGSSFFAAAKPPKPVKEGKLGIRKIVTDPSASLAGITFQLLDPATQTPVGTPFATNAAGHAQSDKVPTGTYLLQETAPANFQPVQPVEVTIDQGATPRTIPNTVIQPGVYD